MHFVRLKISGFGRARSTDISQDPLRRFGSQKNASEPAISEVVGAFPL
jgi:hypothetical protein